MKKTRKWIGRILVVAGLVFSVWIVVILFWPRPNSSGTVQITGVQLEGMLGLGLVVISAREESGQARLAVGPRLGLGFSISFVEGYIKKDRTPCFAVLDASSVGLAFLFAFSDTTFVHDRWNVLKVDGKGVGAGLALPLGIAVVF